MKRSLAAFALALGAGAAPVACTGPHPLIRSGDADSVEVMYGGEVANALPLARQHCAQFERVPRLADTGSYIKGGDNTAVFDCVRP